ncbi:MAG: hypothetical protein V4714_17795 [Bacteroidota bacterium]
MDGLTTYNQNQNEVSHSTEMDSYNISKPSSLVALASTMQKFIDEQKLFSMIQGKKFPNIEAWQFVGLSLGIIPIVRENLNLSTADEIKYQATVDLKNVNTGAIVGCGIAVCSKKERTKKDYDEYAIASMAQTRAVGKAYRLMLSFLMKSAGFEATPAEELENEQVESLKAQVLALVIEKAEGCQTREALTAIWKAYPQFQKSAAFIKAVKTTGEKLPVVTTTTETAS